MGIAVYGWDAFAGDVLYGYAIHLDSTSKNILYEKGAKVPNMRWTIDSRPTTVKPK